MTKTLRLLIILSASSCPLSLAAAEGASEPLTLGSPDGRLRVAFRLDERGRPAFDVTYRDKPAATGTLGLVFAGSGRMREGLKVVGTRRASRDETYSIPVGKASSARDRHHELIISLEEEAPPIGGSTSPSAPSMTAWPSAIRSRARGRSRTSS